MNTIFWLTYMDRKPEIAMLWLSIAAYQMLGEVSYESN